MLSRATWLKAMALVGIVSSRGILPISQLDLSVAPFTALPRTTKPLALRGSDSGLLRKTTSLAFARIRPQFRSPYYLGQPSRWSWGGPTQNYREVRPLYGTWHS